MKYIILLVILSACGPAHHLRRAERLKERMDEQIDKAITKGAEVKRDTVFKEIQVIVPEVKTDTVFKAGPIGDTVTIIQEKLKIKYMKLPGDTVYIDGECEADTVKLIVPVETKTTIDCPPEAKIKWFHWLALFLVLVLLIMIFKK